MKVAVKKLALAVAASFAMAGNASAVLQNFNGVWWDPEDATKDFTLNPLIIRQEVYTKALDPFKYVRGWGKIIAVNGKGQSVFCPSGCELTFFYDNFRENVANRIGNTGFDETTLRGGNITFYLDPTPNGDIFDPEAQTPGTDQDGPIWLTGTAITQATAGINPVTAFWNQTFSGSVFNSVTWSAIFNLDGPGPNSNTDAYNQLNTDQEAGVAINFGDLTFSPSFTNFALVPTSPAVYNMGGSGNFEGKSLGHTPEPASALLAGLGLLGLARIRRRAAAR